MSKPQDSLLKIHLIVAAALAAALLAPEVCAMPWTDARTASLRDLDSVYSFQAPATAGEWNARAADLRRQILLSAGLYPMPKAEPLNVKFHGRVERDGYSMERVSFESRPGLLVAGNLYRPLGKKGPFPGVLNPHGHTSNGRLANTESFASQGRCINQARLGMVAFSYSMVGYNDSFQLSHGFASHDTPEGRELALWGISPMGVQLYNSIRALDFLQSLPDVDGTRLACTGESGGGTQTFLLAAVDERVRAAAPVNMVSGQMQGGCICENGPGLRLGTNNIEIAALTAGRHLLLVSCTGDWTVNTPTVEFPAVRSVYKLLGVQKKISYVQYEADHNYNRQSREAVYAFLTKALGVKAPKVITEPPTTPEPDDQILVWGADNLPDAPTGAVAVDMLRARARLQARTLAERLAADPKATSRELAPAFRTALGVSLPDPDELALYNPSASAGQGYLVRRFAIGRRGSGDKAGASLFSPQEVRGRVLLVHPRGADALAPDGKPGALVQALLAGGREVMVLTPFAPGTRAQVKYFDTYNRTDAAEAVHDILTAWSYLQGRGDPPIAVAGLSDAGLLTLLAAAAVSDSVAPDRLWADMGGLDLTSDAELSRRAYVPGLRLLGDARSACALVAPSPILLAHCPEALDLRVALSAYEALGASGAIQTTESASSDADTASWLLGR